MWPDGVSNPGPLAHESDALPTALCGPALAWLKVQKAVVIILMVTLARAWVLA